MIGPWGSILSLFFRKIGVYLENQCYDPFLHIPSDLSKHFLRKYFKNQNRVGANSFLRKFLKNSCPVLTLQPPDESGCRRASHSPFLTSSAKWTPATENYLWTKKTFIFVAFFRQFPLFRHYLAGVSKDQGQPCIVSAEFPLFRHQDLELKK
jgi:hypothetical protein